MPRARAVSIRVISWLLFAAVFGLTPLAIDAFRHSLEGKGFGLDTTLGAGELFITSAVLGAGLFAEVLTAALEDGKRPVSSVRAILLVVSAGLAAITLALNTAGYVSVSAQTPASQVSSSSVWLFCTTVVTGLATVTIATRP
ncbi:hypothetical protein [Mycobacterium sp. EPa45]|uniref:hypothetical protein n=1 Tax=Mycobacterium sp. EPa45 TaxID=1545728 RepID=UPI00118758B1|nr:hypothetical protein [Mycobacterium sp. EPa45]